MLHRLLPILTSSSGFPVTPLYVKNVPFKAVNDNVQTMSGQPVSNMWNSMAFADKSVGREVVKLFIQYPVKDNILILDDPLLYFPSVSHIPKIQLTPSSPDNDTFNARGDTRGLRGGPNRDTIMAAPSWRRAQPPLTPSRGGINFSGTASTHGMASGALSRRPVPQQPSFRAPQQPNFNLPQQPNFNMPQQPSFGARTASPMSTATPTFTSPPFTTPDEQTLNTFHGFQTLGHQNGQQGGHHPSPVATNTRGGFGVPPTGFQAARSGRVAYQNAPGHLNFNVAAARGGFNGIQTAGPRFPIHHTQTEEYHNTPGKGLGVTFGRSSPAFASRVQSAGLPRSTGMQFGFNAPQMPSPAFSSFQTPVDPFKDHMSPPMPAQAHGASHATVNLYKAINQPPHFSTAATQQSLIGGSDVGRRTQDGHGPALQQASPVKHSRSMPNILEAPSPVLDAEASEFVPQNDKKTGKDSAKQGGSPVSSAYILKGKVTMARLKHYASMNELTTTTGVVNNLNCQKWLADTPTHKQPAMMKPFNPKPTPATESSFSPDKIAMLKPEEKIEYRTVQIRMKEIAASKKKMEAEMAEIEVRQAKIEEEELREQIKLAALQGNVGRDRYASSSEGDDVMESPGMLDVGMPKTRQEPSVTSSEFNSKYPQPTTALYNKTAKSPGTTSHLPTNVGNAASTAYTSQNLGQDQGPGRTHDPSDDGYNSSYDLRMARNVDKLVASPSNSSPNRHSRSVVRPTPMHSSRRFDPTGIQPTWNNQPFNRFAPPRMAPLLHKVQGVEDLSAAGLERGMEDEGEDGAGGGVPLGKRY